MDKVIVVGVCVFILIDAILGTKVSITHGGKFESRRLWSTLKKFRKLCNDNFFCCHLYGHRNIKINRHAFGRSIFRKLSVELNYGR